MDLLTKLSEHGVKSETTEEGFMGNRGFYFYYWSLMKKKYILGMKKTQYRTETCDISIFLFPQKSSVQQVEIVQLPLLVWVSRLCHTANLEIQFGMCVHFRP